MNWPKFEFWFSLFALCLSVFALLMVMREHFSR